MNIIEFAEKICGRELPTWQKELLKRIDSLPRDCQLVYHSGLGRWVIVKEAELSKTSIVPFQHGGYHSRICIIDETTIDNHID